FNNACSKWDRRATSLRLRPRRARSRPISRPHPQVSNSPQSGPALACEARAGPLFISRRRTGRRIKRNLTLSKVLKSTTYKYVKVQISKEILVLFPPNSQYFERKCDHFSWASP